MRTLPFFLISFLITCTSVAQQIRQADRWYFGVNAGMNFNPGAPVAIPGAIVTNEGTTSMSDSVGQLLFYSEGVSVWDKSGTTMPNGTGLMGGISSTVSALAVPYPGNNLLYYLFTLDEAGGTNGFRYSMVDMSLQGGSGDVTTKNVLIKTDVTEKLAAVRKANTSDIWVAVHEWGTDAFYVYPVTASGFQNTPVISNTGMVHTIDALEQNKYGQMKFNICGTKLAACIGYLDTVEVFDFDPSTGVVSNPVTLPLGDHVYGVEFSPDGNLLYVTSYNTGAGYSTLFQYDLTAGSQAAVIASQTPINVNTSGTSFFYAIQMGPDGKIYCCKSFSQYLGVINDPNTAGINCNYVDLGFDLDPNFTGATSALGLPAFVQSYMRGEITCVIPSALSETGNEQPLFQLQNNVSTDIFTLQTNNHEKLKRIAVYDLAGKEISKLNNISGTVSFGSDLSPGCYIVRAESITGRYSRKIVKL